MEGQTSSQDLIVDASKDTKEREYWLDKLSGEWEKSVFPYDHVTIGVKERHLKETYFLLPPRLSERLLEIANRSDVRLYSLLLTTLQVLIAKYTQNDDIIVGVPIYRQEEEDEGDFINTVLALRNRIEAGVTFKELLITVSQNLFEAAENQNYPIKKLLYKLGISFSRDDDFPLFDIAVLLENIHDKRYIHHININTIFTFSRDGGEVKGVLEYNSFLYEEKTIARIINHITHLLQVVLFDVNVVVSTIDFLASEEKKQLLYDFNDTAAVYPQDRTLHQ
jgi:non-ribosomal peptide synthetase component F